MRSLWSHSVRVCPGRLAPSYVVIRGGEGSASKAGLNVFPIFFLEMWPFVCSEPPALLLAGVAFLGVRSVPVGVWSVPPLPILLWLGVPAIRGSCAGLGGAIVDFGTTNLPIPTRFFRYGFDTVIFLIGGFEMSPSALSPFRLPGTTRTTVGGVLSSLDKDSSGEEDSSPLLASLGVPVSPSCFVASREFPPPLWAPSLWYFFASTYFP